LRNNNNEALQRRIYGLILFFLYGVAMLKPVLPTIIYYANYDYIATELCENKDEPEMGCHGKCYLEKLEKKIKPITQNDKPIAIEYLLVKEYPVTTIETDAYDSIVLDMFKRLKSPNYSNHFLISDYSISIFHPPRTLL